MRVVRAAVGALLCLAAVGFGTPAAGAAGSGPVQPVGGPLLTGSGVVVHPGSGAPTLPRGLTAAGWLVADADTGEVLAAKAPHVRFLPASTLKTLTAVTLIPRLDPDSTVRVSYRDAVVEGSKVGLVPGHEYSVRTLFTSLLVVSGNDAAGALAEAAGGMRHTVRLMNTEAQRLQALDTVARTPSGLDAPGESTSAYDLALIARAGLALPDFRDYVGTVRSRVPAPHHKHFQIYTHNRLLTSYKGAIGVKNGYTVAAQATYVGAATRGGHTMIVTLLHAQPYFWNEARALLNWGFAARGQVTPVGSLVAPVDVTTGAGDTSGATVTPASATKKSHTVVLAAHDHSAVSVWQLVLLALSAAAAVTATARRQRRRAGRRLALPPL